MTFLFKSWTHSVTGFSDADLAGAFLIGGRPQDIVSFLKKILCHEKSRSRVVSQSSAESEYMIMANVTLELICILYFVSD